MLRTIFSLSALAAGLAASGALAAPSLEGAQKTVRSAQHGALLLAQDGNIDIYYDARGNRVLVDADTGKVIAIQPPQTRLDRRALRRQLRMQELGRAPVEDDDRYYLDDPDDMARFRRRQLDENGRYIPPPVDDYDSNSGNSVEAYPPAPSDEGYATTYPEAPRSDTIKREPLNEASIEPHPGQGDVLQVNPETQAALPPDTGGKATVDPSLSLGVRQDVAELQVLLDRAGASPGVIDGRFGSNVDKALAAYNQITGSNLKSTDSAAIKAALAQSGGDAFASYTITPEDVAGPYVASIPEDYSQKAKLDRMGYTSVTEALAERFHMDEGYLKSINKGLDFNRPGTIVKVANFGQLVSTPVARIVADKDQKEVFAYDAAGKLVAAYPATIGSADTPSPTGIHTVSRIALDPNYTYNPSINFKQGQNDKILTIPPGPNGPVGSVWIALDKPTYGIHGTPDPSKIGKTESHGCVRLTNWDARELAKLVSPGVTVEFVGGSSVDDFAQQ
ncbi:MULTISPECIES: L,D-transpeptidase family protein [unclassified Mesorhizobium]|uniref:L,D-transpeptidase family protein n=1 Tax=unclassified Mesorhizobium TaxID=325217 RepID=UPI0024152772|nr:MULTISPECIES: L,D-transpeptidase family protein [unclassified Mesorhizobium]MDG4851235.1 L,D-transpeptidase family protein [Mesorhizobium sp. WSM4982]MDG4912513.1 L,D-transpeptidase family protein [Mesorhizobium sp. WSM4983]